MNIAKYKKLSEQLLLRMQFFCLDPKYSNYCEIIEHRKIQSEQSAYIELWKLACIDRYGKLWDIDESEVASAQNRFAKEMRNLNARLLMSPSSINLDRMWFVFFATGDLNVLKAAFEVSGNNAAKSELRVAASDQFLNFRDAYLEKIDQALKKDPDYFRNHETVAGLDDTENPLLRTQYVFDKFQEQIDAANTQLNNADDDDDLNSQVHGILSRIAHDSGSDDERADSDESEAEAESDESDMTPEEKREYDRIKSMGVRFDEIAKDVLKDRYVTKEAKESKRRTRKNAH